MSGKRIISAAAAAALVGGLLVGGASVAGAHPGHDFTGDSKPFKERYFSEGVVGDVSPGGVPMEAMSGERCEDGMAADLFPCQKVDLSSFTPLQDLEATHLNDIWGWEDEATGMQVAIVGTFEGTAFVDVTDGENPVLLGVLDAVNPDDYGNVWGDVRVFEDTAYIVTESFDLSTYQPATGYLEGNGVQIVDLTQFRGATGQIDIVEEPRITDFTQSHNVSINTETGRMYVVGAVYSVKNECAVAPPAGYPAVYSGTGGAIVYDLNGDPAAPSLIGCLNDDGYSHDIQCVVYDGPDEDYQGREICIGSNEDTVTLYDVTDIENPVVLSRLDYEGAAYTHQGWLSEDHTFFFLGDELDELYGTVDERSTYIWDFTDLDDAELIGVHTDGNTSIDHNMFVKDGLLYQSNYTSGLWIYDAWKAEQGRVTSRGFFDVFPSDDRTAFYGTWGNYPYFGDGKVVVTSSDEGLFVLQSRAKSSSQNNGAKAPMK